MSIKDIWRIVHALEYEPQSFDGYARIGNVTIEKAATALRQLLKATEWQPIETAPKDGTEILVWNGESVNHVWFEEGQWRLFRLKGSHGEHLYYLETPPTKWMRLPSGGR
jgi:hypothetical protein